MNRLDNISSANALLLVCGVLVLSAFIAAGGRQPAQPVVAPTPAMPILVIATAVPTVVPTAVPTVETRIMVQAAPTQVPPTPEPQIIVERQVIEVIVTAVPAPTEPPQLQTFSIPEGEDPLSDALLREAMDQ